MAVEQKMIPYSKQQMIGESDRLWKTGQFLLQPDKNERLNNGEFALNVEERFYVNQNSDKSFVEFEDGQVVVQTGYHAEQMRPHGCGISATHMALSIVSDRYKDKNMSVGQFAISALSNHRNDSTDGIVGTPVFNLIAGWYHDGLVYTACHEGDVGGFRHEGDQLEDLVVTMQGIGKSGAKVAGVISVDNSSWRIEGEPTSVSTHMVTISGYRVEEGVLKEVLISDPYVGNSDSRLNRWMDAGFVSKAFTGRAMIYYS